MAKGVNSSAPTTGEVVAGVYNATPPVLVDGQACAIQLDVNGQVKTSGGSGGGGNVNLTGINGVAPALNNALAVELSDGTNAVGTAGNPLSVNVISGGGSNASVGTNGAVAPTSSTQAGGSDGTNLQPLQVDGSKNLKVAVNAALPAGTNVIGHVIADTGSTTAVTGNVTVVQGTGSNLHAVLDASAAVIGHVINDASAAIIGKVGIDQTTPGTTNGVQVNAALPAGANVIGHVIADTGSTTAVTGNVTAVQATGTNLHVVVDSAPSTAVTQGTSPWVVAGNKTNNNAAPGATNVGTLPALANAASPSWSEGNQVAESVDLTGRQRIRGTLTNNNAAPAADGQMALSAIANAAAPSWSEGDLVLESVDLSGNHRIIGTKTNNNAAPTTQLGVLPAIANAAAPTWSEGNQVLESVDLSGRQRVLASQGTAAALTAGWPITGGALAESTAAWTNATAGNTAVTVDVRGYSVVTVTLNQTTTITGGVVSFEVSDSTGFTNAFVIAGSSNLIAGVTNKTITYTLVANTNQAYSFNVSGWVSFRVRLSTVITGTGTVNVGVVATQGPAPSADIVQQIGAVQLVTTVTSAGVRSTVAAAAQADNKLNANIFADSAGVSNPVYVGDSMYGGAFAGAADAARQGWSKARTPTVFKTASVAATATGNSAVWTPGSGNKFRLLGFQITAQGLSATVSAAVTVKFQDATTDVPLGIYDIDVPAVANIVSGVAQISGGAVNVGAFGILSAAINQVLNFNISAAGAGTTGTYRITVWGTEE